MPPQTYTTTVVTGECVTCTLKNEALPGLRIIKCDRLSHKTMPGVTFRVWRDGVLLGDYETDALGEILISDLEPGVYSIKETSTVADHLIDPVEHLWSCSQAKPPSLSWKTRNGQA